MRHEEGNGGAIRPQEENPASVLRFCMINQDRPSLTNGAARTVLVHHYAHLVVFLADICTISTICFQSWNE
ncbi:MAG: hypothetical protein ACJ8GN_24640 [Longimicrobiaceae bacterium]